MRAWIDLLGRAEAASVPVVALLLCAVALLVGPRAALAHARAWLHLLSPHKRTLAAAGALLLAAPVLAQPYIRMSGYLICLLCATLSAVCLLILLTHWDRLSERAWALLQRVAVGPLALVACIAAVCGAWFVLDGMPHTSDEHTYLFQARLFELGRIWLEPPPAPACDSFTMIHNIIDPQTRRWYGTMNAGWPALLSLGSRWNLEFLVNPALFGLALLVFNSFLRVAGYGDLERKLALLLLAVSPFWFFQAASLMSHCANLLFFAIFLRASVPTIEQRNGGWSLLAGLALAANVFIRPLDSALAALPFVARLGWQARRELRSLALLAVMALPPAAAVAASLWYNQALTGDAFTPPMVRQIKLYFEGTLGVGFGGHMGTTQHGDEWPGFYPSDGLQVTAVRFSELAHHFVGCGWVLAVGCLLIFRNRQVSWLAWDSLLRISGVLIVLVYAAHFYHGIAFGPRHYALATPALAVILAGWLARCTTTLPPQAARLARVGVVALVAHTFIFGYPRLLARYATDYRHVNGDYHAAVQQAGLSNALVFVDGAAWKSVFSHNKLPLSKNEVLYAHAKSHTIEATLAAFPERRAYVARRRDGRVYVRPFDPADEELATLTARPVRRPRDLVVE